MPLNTEEQRVGKERIIRIFNFLKAYNEHRNPVKHQLSEQPWVLWLNELPDHADINFVGHIETDVLEQQKAEEDFILKVCRPKLTPAPNPPERIAEWLQDGWKDPVGEIVVIEEREIKDKNGDSQIVRFNDDPQREVSLTQWRQKWKNWAQDELPARETMQIFERCYDLYGRLQKNLLVI